MIDPEAVDRAGEILRHSAPPLEQKNTVCDVCNHRHRCTWLKAAHVPLYAWVCDTCWDEWVSE